MLSALWARRIQGYRTIPYPDGAASLPDRFRGVPVLKADRCVSGCDACREQCPTGAVSARPELSIDMGKCIFCAQCAASCPQQAIAFGTDHRVAVRERGALFVNSRPFEAAHVRNDAIRRLYGRSFTLRQVSAGGCNACESDFNVLTTIGFDLGRFGIQVVASPRHADGILVTGPVTENMRIALQKTYEALPDPRVVIACGTCAISGGLFSEHPEQHKGVENILPVDLYIPGCPPHPLSILDGLLRLTGRRVNSQPVDASAEGGNGAPAPAPDRPTS